MSRDADEIDQLIAELHASGGAPAGPAAGDTGRLERWLRILHDSGGSDLLLVAGAPPSMRVRRPGPAARRRAARRRGNRGRGAPALPPHARRHVPRAPASPTARSASPDLGRFRINLHRERGRAAAAIRAPAVDASRGFASLGLPPSVEALTRLPRGLVLVGGPTGSGKTTTLAALVNEINLREARHIITIEDPIEYEHPHRRSSIEQVEIGVDAPDFPTALRAALRQAPDIIVVGEMRDPETMQIALAAGETGHLVFSSLHTTDVATTVGADRRLVSDRAAEHDPPGAGDGAGGGADADAAAEERRRPDSGGGAADGRLRRAAAHPQERAAAPAPGDHDHPQAGIVHARGVAGGAGQAGLVDRKDALARAGHPEELERLLLPSEPRQASSRATAWISSIHSRRFGA